MEDGIYYGLLIFDLQINNTKFIKSPVYSKFVEICRQNLLNLEISMIINLHCSVENAARYQNQIICDDFLEFEFKGQ